MYTFVEFFALAAIIFALIFFALWFLDISARNRHTQELRELKQAGREHYASHDND